MSRASCDDRWLGQFGTDLQTDLALGPLVTIKTFDCNKKLHDYDGAVLNSETSPLVCPSADSARAAMGQQRRVVNLSAR